jgi:hypothetical protein
MTRTRRVNTSHESAIGGPGRAEVAARRLFDEQVARQWDWSQVRSSVLPNLRQMVIAAAAGRLDDTDLAAAAERGTGHPAAAATLAEQCRTVVRTAREDPGGPDRAITRSAAQPGRRRRGWLGRRSWRRRRASNGSTDNAVTHQH